MNEIESLALVIANMNVQLRAVQAENLALREELTQRQDGITNDGIAKS